MPKKYVNNMKEIYLAKRCGITSDERDNALKDIFRQFSYAYKILIVPPDFTRSYSYAGEITRFLYFLFSNNGSHVDIIPALGTHMPMSLEEKNKFFGSDIPDNRILVHNWQTDTVKLGVIPSNIVSEISFGLYTDNIEVEVNRILSAGKYDLVISIGQVVPHEVVGMANYSKNIFVGLGGREMINKSHMLSAICRMEDTLGVIDSPARKLYDYAQRNFIDGKIPVIYVQTVTTKSGDELLLNGIYVGKTRKPFELAASFSQELNITYLDRRAKKVVAYLDPKELKTTWVGNKGIYRTRMIVDDGGELIVLAPGVKSFGENDEMDMMIRKYGYNGRDYILTLYNNGIFDDRTMSAAHLIQGSSDGRFRITYATCPEKLSKLDIESVGYNWANYYEMEKIYNHKILKDGWNRNVDEGAFYYVGSPALGLWKYKKI